MTATALAAVVLAYATGCVCAGYYLVRWAHRGNIRDALGREAVTS